MPVPSQEQRAVARWLDEGGADAEPTPVDRDAPPVQAAVTAGIHLAVSVPMHRRAPSYVRTGLAALCALMLFPVIVLVLAPLLLFLMPVAFIAIPFMLASFWSGACDTHMETKRIEAWRCRAGLVPAEA